MCVCILLLVGGEEDGNKKKTRRNTDERFQYQKFSFSFLFHLFYFVSHSSILSNNRFSKLFKNADFLLLKLMYFLLSSIAYYIKKRPLLLLHPTMILICLLQ